MSGVFKALGTVSGIAATIMSFIPPLQPIAAAFATNSPIATTAVPITARKPMTAINIFSDEQRAYIATDGAVFSAIDGTIVGLGTKTATFPPVKLAVSIQGKGALVELIEEMDKRVTRLSQQNFLEILPDALRSVRADCKRRFLANEAGGGNEILLWIATYDDAAQRPRCYHIGTTPLPMPDAPPTYTLHEIDGIITPAVDVSLVLPEGYIVNPRQDSIRLLAAQRHHPTEAIGGGCGVGGRCEFFTVGETGVTAEHIFGFPEGVGERADPRNEGVLL
jgi:hypothetical protein